MASQIVSQAHHCVYMCSVRSACIRVPALLYKLCKRVCMDMGECRSSVRRAQQQCVQVPSMHMP